jgi:hypothetical protein
MVADGARSCRISLYCCIVLHLSLVASGDCYIVSLSEHLNSPKAGLKIFCKMADGDFLLSDRVI